jgi:hypothetical protein
MGQNLFKETLIFWGWWSQGAGLPDIAIAETLYREPVHFSEDDLNLIHPNGDR